MSRPQPVEHVYRKLAKTMTCDQIIEETGWGRSQIERMRKKINVQFCRRCRTCNEVKHPAKHFTTYTNSRNQYRCDECLDERGFSADYMAGMRLRIKSEFGARMAARPWGPTPQLDRVHMRKVG